MCICMCIQVTSGLHARVIYDGEKHTPQHLPQYISGYTRSPQLVLLSVSLSCPDTITSMSCGNTAPLVGTSSYSGGVDSCDDVLSIETDLELLDPSEPRLSRLPRAHISSENSNLSRCTCICKQL